MDKGLCWWCTRGIPVKTGKAKTGKTKEVKCQS